MVHRIVNDFIVSITDLTVRTVVDNQTLNCVIEHCKINRVDPISAYGTSRFVDNAVKFDFNNVYKFNTYKFDIANLAKDIAYGNVTYYLADN